MNWDYIFSNKFQYSQRNDLKLMGDVQDNEIVLDIGCVHDRRLHSSYFDSVGLDLNFEYDKPMVKHPIISDAQHIPIRENTIDFVNCQALVEHLPHPELCLSDMYKVMKNRGFILIPVDSRQIYQTFVRFFKEFPFSIRRTLIELYNSATVWKRQGMLHIKQIDLKFINKYFKITRVGYRKKIHYYFGQYGLFWFLKHLGLKIKTVLVNEYAEYYVWIEKRRSS